MDPRTVRLPHAHLVGSVPLSDNAAVFRAVAEALGPHLLRLPDGETGVRCSWIRYLQDVLANHPSIEVAADVPPFRFVQWDGRLIREIPRLRCVPGAPLAAAGFVTGYADMAIASWEVFARLQADGVIPSAVRFQICLPTPTAPTYNNMIPADRPAVLEALTRHFVGEVEQIAAAVPHESIAIQWDVCQEVLAWEGYYDEGPNDFCDETLEILVEVGDAVPRGIDLGYHLCYGSPLDEHVVQPRDAGLLTVMINSIAQRVDRSIEYFHIPVPRDRTDDAYFAPLRDLAIDAATDLYIGLIHHDDPSGDAARLAAARRHVRVDGVATECGMGRGDPARLHALLDAHVVALKQLTAARSDPV
jgi:hypothetical protein